MGVFMVRTQIQLTENQFHLLRDASRKNHISVAELIRRGVDGYLSRDITVSKNDIRARARGIAGKYHSGKNELSEKHDEYLSEVFR